MFLNNVVPSPSPDLSPFFPFPRLVDPLFLLDRGGRHTGWPLYLIRRKDRSFVFCVVSPETVR